ncbi:MAG: DinB family protein [Chloroflexi bacterium]|nr:DinB family protein [Chloroflexota bacterium]
MDAEERHALLDQLAAMPVRVSREAMMAVGKPRPAGEWSLNAVVGHFLRVEEEVWTPRFRQMAKEENPHWEWWEPDGVDWEGEYGGQRLSELVEKFVAQRMANVEYLRRLPEAGWQRVATHRTFGVLDVAGLCREMLKHDENHIGQIGKIE